MADRYPLVYNPSANQIQELQSGDSIDLGGGNLKNTVFSGIITATGFSGDGSALTNIAYTETSTLDVVLSRGSTSSRSVTFGPITGTTGTFTGDVSVANLTAANVTIAGTITYDDVTNVDSLGIGTFRTGIKVLAGGANIVGTTTATSFIKTGGTSSQFLKADGSSDGTAYISAIGISSAGTSIGNATTLNFIGAGNTFAVNGNTIDVSIQGSAGGSGGGSGGGGGALDITSCLFI
tara:strand:- start:180 stop:887 length:708 start_codon:yes stop_codon:yes gene_type:complete